MPVEVEQKYRIQKPSEFRKKLKKLGAQRLHAGLEHNELFDCGTYLLEKGGILRVREYGKEKGVLTYKGPRLKGRYKKRREYETHVEPQAMKLILKQAGFKKVAAYSKNREEFRLNKVLVTLDCLKRLGWFVEIEGKPAEIRKTEKTLGLSPSQREEKTYLELSGRLSRSKGSWVRKMLRKLKRR